MKNALFAASFCLAAALMGGCASRHVGIVYHAGDENPPDFVTGPIAVALTNLNGFSAHVTWSNDIASDDSRAKSGELLGRDGKLVYQPTLPVKGKRARTEGGLFFIWDESVGAGYVMSDALQGYAPIKSPFYNAGQLVVLKTGIQEDIDGHPTHRCDAHVTSDNGGDVHFTIWQADDLNHFPVRITGPGANGGAITMDFSDIRQEYPDQSIFLPPDGFTPYANSVDMMNELIVRDASLVKKHDFGESEAPTPSPQQNWHPGGIDHP
jgi:hypothetical protein